MSSPASTPPPPSKRSCLPCYQRKLKCDKKVPCTRCSTRGSKCEYSHGPIRRNRGPRKQADAQITSSQPALGTVLALRDGNSNTVTLYNTDFAVSKESDLLVIDGTGKSRLLSAVGWASFKDETNGISDTLLGDTNAEQNFTAPLFMPLFNQLPLSGGVLSRPDQRGHAPLVVQVHLRVFWRVFCRNVDPIVKILHKPTVEFLLKDVERSGFTSCSAASHALLMSIAFAAVNSLRPSAVEDLFGEDQKTLSKTLGQAVEHSLFRAKLSQTHDLVALQAFVISITCTPPDPSRSRWTFIGLAVRIATSMGLHRDGSKFGLSPFEAEIRRRLWWHLLLIDIRTSEDFSCNPFTYNGNCVQLPVNLDDEDMDPNAKEDYVPKRELTEMTFSLIRYEGCLFILSLLAMDNQTQTHNYCCEGSKTGSECTGREAAIDKFQRDLEEKYLKFADRNSTEPRSRLISRIGRSARLKMRLIFGLAQLRQGPTMDGIVVDQSALTDDLFSISVDLLESQLIIRTWEEFENWKWMLKSYNQWHAMAIILTQLLSELNKMQTPTEEALSPMMKRAWVAADKTFELFEDDGIYENTWGPLSTLRQKVSAKLKRSGFVAEMTGFAMDVEASDVHIEEDSWTLPTVLAEFGSTSQSIFTSTEGMFSEPWPLYFPTNFFSGIGM